MPNYQSIQNVSDFASLVRYLEDELEWPFQGVEDVEDALYEFEAEEFGLDEKHSAKIKSIKQIAPLAANQPWGIFWIDFGGQKPSVVALRGVLRGLVKKKRESANESDRQRFAIENLLFILTSESFDKFDFAYFRGDSHSRSTLSLFGWEKGDTHLRTLCEHNLPKLCFPANPADTDSWLKLWRDAFDVEKVTKRFFEDYKAVFSRMEKLLERSIPGVSKEAQETRGSFAQRIFNRLMFIYFLQKKGWLSLNGRKDYLQSLYEDAARVGDDFFSKRLYFLFFHGLSFAGEATATKTKGELEKIIGDVPYLNGGLFEIEDEFDVRGVVSLPNDIFGEILNFFSHYNFTVEESTPSDVQVAVDPEMLGKIFEQIITERESEKAERKSKGRYYTPRYIVSFMYREAIKHFLAETGLESRKIKELVDYHKADIITIPEAETLLDKLDQLRILDPACGSGAYLLGCLQEIFTIRQKLDTRSKIASSKDDYHRKLRVIQQNIYGVDLDNFAVQIARLRLWLSLIVDFEGEKPEPLPNLDFKIEQGDSLTAPNPNDEQGSLSGDLIREFAKAKADFFLSVDEAGRPIRASEKEARKKAAENKRAELGTEIGNWRAIRGFSPAQGFDWQIEFGEVFLNGGFNVVLANPPYGAETSDKALRENFFGRDTTQSKESYALFIARGLQLLQQNGTLCYIVSDTWRTIKSHKPLRQKLLEETTVKHFVDLPAWIFDATVNTNIITMTKTPAPESHSVIAGDLHNLPNKDWDTLYKNLEAIAEHGFDAQTLTYARYTYQQKLISSFENCSFFIASPKLYELMSDARFQKLGAISEVKVGLQTADNAFYLRKRNGVRGTYGILDESKLLNEAEIAGLTDYEKHNGIDPTKYGGKHFVPYDKGGESDASGGWLPNYHVPTGYFIDWSEDSITRLKTFTQADIKRFYNVTEIKQQEETKIASRFQNSHFYFRRGITFSDTGFYAPTFRFNASAVFDVMGMTVFPSSIRVDVLLPILTSKLIRYFIKNNINHTVHTQVDGLKLVPLVKEQNHDGLESIVSTIVDKQKSDPFYPYHLGEQNEVDSIVCQLYGLSAEDIREVEIWYCRRYETLARAQGFWTKVELIYADYLEHREIILSKPATYWNEHPIRQIIARNEDTTVEFKEILETTVIKPANQLGVNKVLRAICSFLNAEGGIVLIGIKDETLEIVGVDREMAELSLNKDQYGIKILQMIEDTLKPKITGNDLISVTLEPTPEGHVCRIDVKASREPIFYGDKHLFVRYGTKTQKIEGAVAMTKWAEERKRKWVD